jgi:hypothetical protein
MSEKFKSMSISLASGGEEKEREWDDAEFKSSLPMLVTAPAISSHEQFLCVDQSVRGVYRTSDLHGQVCEWAGLCEGTGSFYRIDWAQDFRFRGT